MSGYSTIVAATDLSDPSLPALRHAADLAARLGARLIATYVVDDRLPPLVLAQSGESIEALLDDHRARAEQTLRRTIAERLPGVAVEPVVRVGTVHTEIVALARAEHADLIVVGQHGHGFLSHALSGNTADRVLRHAPCPVLVVAEAH